MENPKITSEEIALIKEAQAGNMAAFNKLYYRYYDFVVRVLDYYIRDEDEARDLTNIVFLKVYNKLSQFNSYESFGGWIRVIASRVALDYLRNTHNKLTVTNEDIIGLMGDSSVDNIDTDLVNQISYDQILKEVEKLTDTARRVFKLFYINGLTVEQISNRLDIPKGTVKSHLSRSRQKIKNQLKQTNHDLINVPDRTSSHYRDISV